MPQSKYREKGQIARLGEEAHPKDEKFEGEKNKYFQGHASRRAAI